MFPNQTTNMNMVESTTGLEMMLSSACKQEDHKSLPNQQTNMGTAESTGLVMC